jgi:chromosomal replication initiation ATPase DnaA
MKNDRAARPEQLVFDLPQKTALGRDDFFVSLANERAVSAIEDWQNWPGAKLVLTGPEGAGKSHLAHVWAGMAQAQILVAADLHAHDIDTLTQAPVCLEDVPDILGNRAAEQSLFHLHNLMAERGLPLLLTGQGVPAHWPFTLPDLASRVQAIGLARLESPDDTLLAVILVKLFDDRQISVNPGLIGFILNRLDRSFAAARDVVAALDAAALARRQAVTTRLARQVLDKMAAKRQELRD